ncbi:MAG: LCP family protein, partial [Aristaeellaceae bacterium]
LCKVISQHIGVKVEKYILFDFNQIQTIIDYLGGVTITVTDAEADYLNRYRISRTATTPSMNKAGTYLFGGHAAVIYMRIRKAGGGGDFMRTQRVRTVLSTLADQCREISYEKARDLVDSVMANTTLTNMNLDEMVQAMEYAYGLRGATVEELRIPQDGDVSPINYAGMAVQEIDWVHSREVMDDYLQNSFLVMDED